MEDKMRMHGSTQTQEFSGFNDAEDNIAKKIGIKSQFPKNKKILIHKKEKIGQGPLEILNKFRKKVFGISAYQKRLSYNNKDISQQHNNQNFFYKNKQNLVLEVQSLKLSKTDDNSDVNSIASSKLTNTHSNFPKIGGISLGNSDVNQKGLNKKAFITGIKSSDKDYCFNKTNQAFLGNETVYSNYILKDFASPYRNEFDINLNYNTFYGLFKKDKDKEKKKKTYENTSKHIAEMEKEKKIINKIERRIQTEFLQKISFPSNEKYMNKTLNNFNFNKGLFKINDLRGSLSSAEKIKTLVSKENNLNISNSPKNSKDKYQHINSSQINSNKNLFANSTNQESWMEFKQTNKSRTTSIDNMDNNNLASFNNPIDSNKFSNKAQEMYSEKLEEAVKNEKSINYNCNSNKDFHKHIEHDSFRAGLMIKNSLDKKHYVFNLNQSTNSHVLRMLRINQIHEKLGLTKRVKLVNSNNLNERLLREKIKGNFQNIITDKGLGNFGDNNNKNKPDNNYKVMLKNILNPNELEKNYFYDNFTNGKYFKINKNYFDTKIPDAEKKNELYNNNKSDTISDAPYEINILEGEFEKKNNISFGLSHRIGKSHSNESNNKETFDNNEGKAISENEEITNDELNGMNPENQDQEYLSKNENSLNKERVQDKIKSINIETNESIESPNQFMDDNKTYSDDNISPNSNLYEIQAQQIAKE